MLHGDVEQAPASEEQCLQSLIAVEQHMGEQLDCGSGGWSPDPRHVKPAPGSLHPPLSDGWPFPEPQSISPPPVPVEPPLKSPPSYFEHISKYAKIKNERDVVSRPSCSMQASIRFHPRYNTHRPVQKSQRVVSNPDCAGGARQFPLWYKAPHRQGIH